MWRNLRGTVLENLKLENLKENFKSGKTIGCFKK